MVVRPVLPTNDSFYGRVTDQMSAKLTGEVFLPGAHYAYILLHWFIYNYPTSKF